MCLCLCVCDFAMHFYSQFGDDTLTCKHVLHVLGHRHIGNDFVFCFVSVVRLCYFIKGKEIGRIGTIQFLLLELLSTLYIIF